MEEGGSPARKAQRRDAPRDDERAPASYTTVAETPWAAGPNENFEALLAAESDAWSGSSGIAAVLGHSVDGEESESGALSAASGTDADGPGGGDPAAARPQRAPRGAEMARTPAEVTRALTFSAAEAAWAVLQGTQVIENRNFRLPSGCWIAIHVGKQQGPARAPPAGAGAEHEARAKQWQSSIVGVFKVRESRRPTNLGGRIFADGPVCNIIEAVIRLRAPVTVPRGNHGSWPMEEEGRAQVVAQLQGCEPVLNDLDALALPPHEVIVGAVRSHAGPREAIAARRDRASFVAGPRPPTPPAQPIAAAPPPPWATAALSTILPHRNAGVLSDGLAPPLPPVFGVDRRGGLAAEDRGPRVFYPERPPGSLQEPEDVSPIHDYRFGPATGQPYPPLVRGGAGARGAAPSYPLPLPSTSNLCQICCRFCGNGLYVQMPPAPHSAGQFPPPPEDAGTSGDARAAPHAPHGATPVPSNAPHGGTPHTPHGEMLYRYDHIGGAFQPVAEAKVLVLPLPPTPRASDPIASAAPRA